jgi:DNA-binding GntR family transcriptional regulator
MDELRLARDDVYRRLRADIIACRLSPGTELREAELAERFDVSKSPVRDALHRLEMEQLVSVLPRRGYQITPISVRDAQELREIRSVIEQACVRKAAEMASDTALRELDRFRRFGGKDEEDFIAYNREFHSALTSLAGNRRMADYSRNLGEQHERLVRMSISRSSPRDYAVFVCEHGDIIDALQARDGRKAAKLVHKHIKNGEKRIVAALSCAAIVP